MERASKLAFTFHVHFEDGRQQTVELDQDIIKIGKLSSSHLRLEDDSVSRMHAVIEVNPEGEAYVIDVGSAAGTFVNGKQVNKSRLQTGDELRFGSVTVRVGMVGKDPTDEHAGGFMEEDHTMVSDINAIQPPASAVPVSNATIAGMPVLSGAAAATSATSVGAGAIPPVPAGVGAPAFAGLPLGGGSVANPFAAPVVGKETSDSGQYRMVASGPAVPPDEVDSADHAIEVTVMWGTQVLRVAHLSPPRGFSVGDSVGPKGRADTDFVIGSELLGTDRLPVVVESGSGFAVLIPRDAQFEVTQQNRTWTTTDLASTRSLVPSNELPGAQLWPIARDATAKLEYKGFGFLVKSVHAARPVGIGTGPVFNWKNQFWTGVSLLVHIAFLLMFYFLPPRSASLSLDLLNQDSRLIKYLMEPPEAEEEKVEWMQGGGEKQGGTGTRHKDEEGQMGKQESPKTRNKYGIKGPKDNQDPHMARENAKEEAKTAGILGSLRQVTGSFNAPTSPYGRDTALGNDPMSALGALMGDQIGDNFGYGGLGLRGTGRGGGGTGEGTIGLGNLGRIGHGAGTGTGSGYGSGGGGGLRGREARAPTIRPGAVESFGGLSKEVIRRVVHRHLNEVRFCYEEELKKRPDLDGRVTVKFIISPSGAVQSSAVSDSSLGNNQVETCIAQAVRRWTFPSPEGGGIVTVNYPFMLAASGG